MKPIFFASPSAFRAFLQEHHAQPGELWVGFYKKDSGRPSITWPEALDVALCFGWIDGVRKSLGDDSYTIRFTARKPRSLWSAVNVKRARELTRMGLMQPPGVEAFERRVEERSVIYSYEQKKAPQLSEEDEKRFRARKKAWDFFQAQAPWYRRTATWWIISAKRPETRMKRLLTLIDDSEHGRTIPPLTRAKR